MVYMAPIAAMTLCARSLDPYTAYVYINTSGWPFASHVSRSTTAHVVRISVVSMRRSVSAIVKAPHSWTESRGFYFVLLDDEMIFIPPAGIDK